MYGNGWPGIDGERGEDREDLVEEPLPETGVMLRHVVVVEDRDAFGEERGADVGPDGRVFRHELEDAFPRGGELLGGGPAIGRHRRRPRLDLLAQAGDPDLEELVEVRGEDGQELGSLEEWIAIVAGLVEDPRVELEPGQLAVQIRERRGPPAPSSGDAAAGGAPGLGGLEGGHRGRLLGADWRRSAIERVGRAS